MAELLKLVLKLIYELPHPLEHCFTLYKRH